MTQPQRQPNFQRVAAQLQQRLAETVANYEGELAMREDRYQDQVEALQAEVERLSAENESLQASKK